MFLTYREIIHHLSQEIPQKWIDHDVWRQENFYYGFHADTSYDDQPALVVGAKSGILPLKWAMNMPCVPIYVIEHDRLLRQALKDSSKNLGLSNIMLYFSVSEYCDAARSEYQRLGKVWIDWNYFSEGLLEILARDFKIGYLAGEFDELQANPLWLHRLSRDCADRFFWHNLTCKAPMASRSSGLVDVSVIVSNIKSYENLESCLDSLVSQALNHIEIFVVVPEGNAELINFIMDWSVRDNRISPIIAAVRTQGQARSLGLRRSTGVFVTFVDGSDWVDEAMLLNLSESAVRYNSDIVRCGYRCWRGGSTKIDVVQSYPLEAKAHNGHDSNVFLSNSRDVNRNLLGLGGCMFRRQFLLDNGIEFLQNISVFDEVPFIYISLALSERTTVLPGCYYNYREGLAALNPDINDERLFSNFVIFRVLKGFVRQHHRLDLELSLMVSEATLHQHALSFIQPSLIESYKTMAGVSMLDDKISLLHAELMPTVEQCASSAEWLGELLMGNKSAENGVSTG